MQLSFVRNKNLGEVQCDFYIDEENEVWMTQEQIGKALGYSDPVKAISRIHTHNKDRLDRFSVGTKVLGTDGKMHDTYIYDLKGISEICRWSSKPQANQFVDWAWGVMESYRKGELAPAPRTSADEEQLNLRRAGLLTEMAVNFKDILSPESVALLASHAAKLKSSILPH
ncbi:BRO family protein [Paenibacillus sp. FSL R5-0345]|uniref:BRO family protein n=1 Tax=Paenibacillus sp. FSL R5-0345 TaxID=1536770 RepID=UPI00069417DC|nr:BRO family protein [Paenibacillus sp. FSL R5-0345]